MSMSFALFAAAIGIARSFQQQASCPIAANDATATDAAHLKDLQVQQPLRLFHLARHVHDNCPAPVHHIHRQVAAVQNETPADTRQRQQAIGLPAHSKHATTGQARLHGLPIKAGHQRLPDMQHVQCGRGRSAGRCTAQTAHVEHTLTSTHLHAEVRPVPPPAGVAGRESSRSSSDESTTSLPVGWGWVTTNGPAGRSSQCAQGAACVYVQGTCQFRPVCL